MKRFAASTRSFELGHTVTENFDSQGRLYKLERESTVKEINVAHIAGPIITYMKTLSGTSRR